MEIELEEIHESLKALYNHKGNISSSFMLKQGAGKSSLGQAKLRSVLRRYGIKNAHEFDTFGDIMALTTGEVPEVKASSLVGDEVLSFDNLSAAVGIDIEPIDNFSVASDYWSDNFYQDNFSKEEIAYCTLQEKPLEHFAARWCIKEATFKCLPEISKIAFSNVQTVKRQDGHLQVHIIRNGSSIELPVVVSLSHSGKYAIAVASTKELKSSAKNTLLEDLRKECHFQVNKKINELTRQNSSVWHSKWLIISALVFSTAALCFSLLSIFLVH